MPELSDTQILHCVRGVTDHWHVFAPSGESAVAEIIKHNPESAWQFPTDMDGKIDIRKMAEERKVIILLFPDDTPISVPAKKA